MSSPDPDKYKHPTTDFFKPRAPRVRPVTPVVGNHMMLACLALVRSTNNEPWDRDGIQQARAKALYALEVYARSRGKLNGAAHDIRKRRKRKPARDNASIEQQGGAPSSSQAGELGDFGSGG